MSESIERTRAPRPMFTGTLRLKPRPAPTPEVVAAPEPPRAAVPGSGRIIQRIADLAECRRRFPVVFDAVSPLPLAIGIHKPLGGLIGANRAGFLLAWWCSWPAYVAAVAAGGCRYGLDGIEDGVISEEQRLIAGRLRDARALGQSEKDMRRDRGASDASVGA